MDASLISSLSSNEDGRKEYVDIGLAVINLCATAFGAGMSSLQVHAWYIRTYLISLTLAGPCRTVIHSLFHEARGFSCGLDNTDNFMRDFGLYDLHIEQSVQN